MHACAVKLTHVMCAQAGFCLISPLMCSLSYKEVVLMVLQYSDACFPVLRQANMVHETWSKPEEPDESSNGDKPKDHPKKPMKAMKSMKKSAGQKKPAKKAKK